MPFNPNIPQPSHLLSDSQGDLLGNMQQLDTSFGMDHYTFSNQTVNNGKHAKVSWVDQSAAVPAAPASAVVVAYGFTQSSITTPYYKRDNIVGAFPLAPIKAYAACTVSAGPALVIDDGFNLTLTSIVQAGNTDTITFAITAPMRTANYGVLISSNAISGPRTYYSGQTTTAVVVNFSNAPATPYSFTVSLLET